MRFPKPHQHGVSSHPWGQLCPWRLWDGDNFPLGTGTIGSMGRSLEDVPNQTISPCLALPVPGSSNPLGSLRGSPTFPTSDVHGLKWENASFPAVWGSGGCLSPRNLSAPSPKHTQQLASTLLVHCNNTEEGKNHP